MMSTDCLIVDRLSAGYGDLPVLHNVSFSVGKGKIVAIVGANGAGKTTLLSTIAGLIRPLQGHVTFLGSDIAGYEASELPSRGIVLVPEGGRLFPFMTVEENLELGAYIPSARATVRQRMDEVMTVFPILSERRTQFAGKLSGGERQMCAIARALMSRPSLLMLDEPSVGLSPLMAERVLETIADLARSTGLTVVIVEQRVTEVLEIADKGYILDHGRIAQEGTGDELLHDQNVQETYMGL
jgi:branched-chain amino acid transport system ATP-binding protein